MINSIIDEISIAINAEFGDDYKIHTESIEQGLVEPCFSIVCINPTNKLFLGNTSESRHYRTNQFCIHYFPCGTLVEDDEIIGKNQEMMDVLDRLYSCLEVINDTDGNADVRGTDMHGEVADGVLNFFVNYNFFTKTTYETSNMETYEQNTTVKG